MYLAEVIGRAQWNNAGTSGTWYSSSSICQFIIILLLKSLNTKLGTQ